VGRLEESVTDPSITFTLIVDTSPGEDKSALVENGQTATRDIIGDNNPTFVDEYAFGSDTSDVVESDNSLTTVATNDLDAAVIQDLSGDEFDISVGDTDPLAVTNNGLELLQTGFIQEGETADSDTQSKTTYSDGIAAAFIDAQSNSISYSFTTAYDIPSPFTVVRGEFEDGTDDVVLCDLILDGEKLLDDSFIVQEDLEWYAEDVLQRSDVYDNVLPAGTHTIEVQYSSSTGNRAQVIDLFGLVDTTWSGDPSNFDNTVHEDNGYLDDPSLYPSQYPSVGYTDLQPASTDIAIDALTVDQSYTDISNNQSIDIQPGGTFDNTDSETVNYTSRVTEVTIGVALSRYPVGENPQSATPRFGYNGQILQSQTLTADLNAVQRNEIGEVLVRSFTGSDTASGSTFAEGGQQSNGTLITRARVPEFIKQSGQRVVSSERLRWINDPEN